MHSQYSSNAIQALRDQQVRFAPREKRLEQIERAETLLREIDVEKTYSYEYVCWRITTFRPETTPLITMSGEELRADLHNFIEDLSESCDLRAEELNQPVHTVEELTKMFSVSSKTISRWRQQGSGQPQADI